MIDHVLRQRLLEQQKVQKLSDIEKRISELATKDPEEELLFHKGLTKALLKRLDLLIILEFNMLKAMKKGKK